MTTVDVKERVRDDVEASRQQQATGEKASRGHTTTGTTAAAARLLHLAEAAHGLALPVLRGRHVLLVMGEAVMARRGVGEMDVPVPVVGIGVVMHEMELVREMELSSLAPHSLLCEGSTHVAPLHGEVSGQSRVALIRCTDPSTSLRLSSNSLNSSHPVTGPMDDSLDSIAVDEMGDDEIVARFAYDAYSASQFRRAPRWLRLERLPLDVRKAALKVTLRLESFGKLDALPNELLVMIMEYLDMQSLTRLTAVSSSWRAFIPSLAAYNDLLKYAPEALGAFRQLGKLQKHNISSLHKVLRDPSSSCCYEWKRAAQLTTSTCERACGRCLEPNRLGFISIKEAAQCFNLSREQRGQLAPRKGADRAFAAVPERYWPHEVNAYKAKTMALEVHGSIEALEEHVESLRHLVPEWKLRKWRYLHQLGSAAEDPHLVAAWVEFPCLERRDETVRCVGCQWCKEFPESAPQAERGKWPLNFTTGDNAGNDFDSFTEHARRCFGVKMMARGLGTSICRVSGPHAYLLE